MDEYLILSKNKMSEAFVVKMGLEQGDALSPMLFNLALEKTIREMQKKSTGLTIGKRKIQVLGFANDLNILKSSLNETKRVAQVLKQAFHKVRLIINREKAKIMKLLESKDSTDDANDDEYADFEKVN